MIAQKLRIFVHSEARAEQEKLYSDQEVASEKKALKRERTVLEKQQAKVKRLEKKLEDSVSKRAELKKREAVAEPLPDIYIHQDMKHGGPNMTRLLKNAMERARRGYVGFTVDLEKTYKRHGATLDDHKHTMLVIAWTSIRSDAGDLEKTAIEYARMVAEETDCEIRKNDKDGGQGLASHGPWYIYFCYEPKLA